jgi:hypothetical protein
MALAPARDSTTWSSARCACVNKGSKLETRDSSASMYDVIPANIDSSSRIRASHTSKGEARLCIGAGSGRAPRRGSCSGGTGPVSAVRTSPEGPIGSLTDTPTRGSFPDSLPRRVGP